MNATVAVVVVAVVAAGSAFEWAVRRRSDDPIDPASEVSSLARWARLGPTRAAAIRRRLDRTSASGLLLTIGFLLLLVAALVVGVVFDMVTSHAGLARWDESVARWGSTHATSTSTNILTAVTQLGGTIVVVVVAIVVAAVDAGRQRRESDRRARNRDVVYFLIVAIGGEKLVANLLKWIVRRDRPNVVHLVHATGSSFPSGHSATAAVAYAAVALVLTRSARRRARGLAAAAAVFIAVSVGASRALLGVHWLTDVVAGLAVGWGWFLVSAIVFGSRLVVRGGHVAKPPAPLESPAAERLPT